MDNEADSEYVVIQTSKLNVLPTKHASSRVKITSFDLCSSFIALGSNSGTLYFLDNESLYLKSHHPTGQGEITLLSICSDEAFVASASSSGIIQITKVPGELPWRKIYSAKCKQHEGALVTSLIWGSGNDLFIGDAKGKVSVFHVPSNKAASYLLSTTADLLFLQSPIVQMDFLKDFLLVSTMNHSYVCDTKLETFHKIGSKNRCGEYGACFTVSHIHEDQTLYRKADKNLSDPNCKNTIEIGEDAQEQVQQLVSHTYSYPGSGLAILLRTLAYNDCPVEIANDFEESFDPSLGRIICCRPGPRLWECSLDGKVLATHHFKTLPCAPPATMVEVPIFENPLQHYIVKVPQDATQLEINKGVFFKRIFQYSDHFLLAVSSNAFFLINSRNFKIILYSFIKEGIANAKVFNDTFMYSTLDHQVHKCLISPIDAAIIHLYNKGLYSCCAQMCLEYLDNVNCSTLLGKLGSSLLFDLLDNLEDSVLLNEIASLKEKLFNSNMPSDSAYLPDIDSETTHKMDESNDDNLPSSHTADDCTSSCETPSCLENEPTQKIESPLKTFVNITSLKENNYPLCNKVNWYQDVPISKSFHKYLIEYESKYSIFSHYLITDFLQNVLCCSDDSLNLDSLLPKHTHKLNREHPFYPIKSFDPCSSLTSDNEKYLNVTASQELVQGTPCETELSSDLISEEIFLKDFLSNVFDIIQELCCSVHICKEKLFHDYDIDANKVFLFHWLESFCDVMQKLATQAPEIFKFCCSQGLNSGAVWKEMVVDASNLIILCIQSGILIYKGNNTLQMTTCVTEIDVFYSNLIESSHCFLDVHFILDHLHNTGNGFYPSIWTSLFNRLCTICRSNLRVKQPRKAINNFSRSQRILHLKDLLKDFDELIVEAARLDDSNATSLYDVIYFSRLQTEVEREYLMFVFLQELGKTKNIAALYTKFWSTCPEIQCEIVGALLKSQNGCRSDEIPQSNISLVPMEDLLSTVLHFPPFNTLEILKLCANSGYYSGVLQICLLHMATPLHNLLPLVFRSMCKKNIAFVIENLDYPSLSEFLSALVKFILNNEIYFNCDTFLLNRDEFHTQGDKMCSICKLKKYLISYLETSRLLKSKGISTINCSFNLKCDFGSEEVISCQEKCGKNNVCTSSDMEILAELWESCYPFILRRMNPMDLLQIISSLSGSGSKTILNRRFYRLCILTAMIEVAHRPLLHDSFHQLFWGLLPDYCSLEIYLQLKTCILDGVLSKKRHYNQSGTERDIYITESQSSNQVSHCSSDSLGENLKFPSADAQSDSEKAVVNNSTLENSSHCYPSDTCSMGISNQTISSKACSPDSNVSVESLFLEESNQDHVDSPPTPKDPECFDQPSGFESQIQSNHDLQLSVSETKLSKYKNPRPRHHWGVRVNIFNDVCILCHLGLTVEVMLSVGGLVVFPCSHIVHAVCLGKRERICFTCIPCPSVENAF